MTNIRTAYIFFDEGRENREREDFQNFLFQDVDMRNRSIPVSFQRSDFRGATFRGSHFWGNNFGNADFIDAVAIDSSFRKCSFRHTEILNSYFENTLLKENLYSSASFVKSHFEKCVIHLSAFNANTIRECQFHNCEISNTKFDKCSIDEVRFVNTKISDCDISSNTAVNLYFDHCSFENVVIDGDYIGSYFFKGEFLDKLRMKYRGKIIKIDLSTTEILKNLFRIHLERGRYYEALNILVQINMLEKKRSLLFSPVVKILSALLKEKNNLKRLYQLEKVFDILEYYYDSGYILLIDYFKILGYFETRNTGELSVREQLFWTEKVTRLKSLINITPIGNSLMGIDQEDVLVEITIENKDKKQFIQIFDGLASSYGKRLNITEKCYHIIGYRKGSLVIQLIMCLPVALIMLKSLQKIIAASREVVKETSLFLIQVRLEYAVHSSLSNFKKLKEHSQTNRLVADIYKSTSKANAKDTKLELQQAEKALSLMKSFIVYPNALGNTEK